ncbi:DUF6069 family protein [Rhizohabitans arisaemae]|uniref:DUF6069 family protein n=1 Tax=Rhizohabitans arisaemae TaxID=2720610 RepID=UPI0024B1B968|nr:DUF6069 family protein [Rhizohabitans arisaemae]
MSTTTPTRRSSNLSTRLWVAAGAVFAPVPVWLGAGLAGADLKVTMAGQPPMSIGVHMVLTTALAGALAGLGSHALLTRFSARGRTAWTALALVALLLSFAPLLTVEAATGTIVALAAMHVAVAAVLIPGLRRA